MEHASSGTVVKSQSTTRCPDTQHKETQHHDFQYINTQLNSIIHDVLILSLRNKPTQAPTAVKYWCKMFIELVFAHAQQKKLIETVKSEFLTRRNL